MKSKLTKSMGLVLDMTLLPRWNYAPSAKSVCVRQSAESMAKRRRFSPAVTKGEGRGGIPSRSTGGAYATPLQLYGLFSPGTGKNRLGMKRALSLQLPEVKAGLRATPLSRLSLTLFGYRAALYKLKNNREIKQDLVPKGSVKELFFL